MLIFGWSRFWVFYAYTSNSASVYGIGAATSPSSWSINGNGLSLSNTHMMFDATLFYNGVGDYDHVLAGYGFGTIDSQTLSNLDIMFEFEQSGTFHFQYVSGHAIPSGDTGNSEVWQSSYNSMTSDYTTTAYVSSTHYSSGWSVNFNVGTSDSTGNTGVWQETLYPSGFSGTCDSYSQYNTASSVYVSSSVSTSNPSSVGSAWSGSCSNTYNSPYTSSGSSCTGTFDYWGS